MKIMYLLPAGLFNAAGMERVTTIKANYLADACNYDVSIVTTEQMGRPVFYPLSDKVHLYHLDIGINENYGKESYLRKIITRFVKVSAYRKKLGELLFQVRPDITVSTLGGWDIEFINDLKDGSIKIGELHFPGNYRELSARKLHNSFFPVFIGQIMTLSFKRKCKKLARLVVLTEEEKTYWKEPNNVEVIPNPLPFVAQRFSTTKNKKAIAVGRLAYEKGFDLLIEAWGKVAVRHPDWELVIYGNGPEKEALSELIGKNKLNEVVKLHAPVDNIDEVYPDYSMLVFPTRYLDSFGMVIIEAMSCGVPAIASGASCCGPKDLIQDGVTGFLADAGNRDEFAATIRVLIESDRLREEMGKAALKFSANFRMEEIMKRWVQLFEKLMK
ncbi:glycosyl transferase [Bacteroidia bacterium]|nr:glycosyl transferase [Bacteroidia bacterium]